MGGSCSISTTAATVSIPHPNNIPAPAPALASTSTSTSTFPPDREPNSVPPAPAATHTSPNPNPNPNPNLPPSSSPSSSSSPPDINLNLTMAYSTFDGGASSYDVMSEIEVDDEQVQAQKQALIDAAKAAVKQATESPYTEPESSAYSVFDAQDFDDGKAGTPVQQQQDTAGYEQPDPTASDTLRPTHTPVEDVAPPPLLRDHTHDVNEWQATFESILSLPAESLQQQLVKAEKLKALSERFRSECARLGKIIVEESGLPEHQRTYQPLKGKGIAGGEKYHTAGIFIKLTRDFAGIYGGDMGAAKAAKHEIKSLQALISCNIEDLFFPLMCIVDYLGLRLVCTSYIAGVSSTSQQYGSSDAGKTIALTNPIMNDKAKRACEMLNLAPHNVIDARGRAAVMWGPCDLEGHVIPRKKPNATNPKDTFDTYYLLDFARLCPPECFSVVPHGLHKDYVIYPSNSNAPITYGTTDEKTFQKYWFLEQEYAVREAAGLPPAPLDFTGIENEKKKRMALLAKNLPIDIKVAPKSEGLMCYNAASTAPINERAEKLFGQQVRGDVILFEDTGRVFFRLLRFELVRDSQLPMSSDALSGFGCCRHCTAIRTNADVDACPHHATGHHYLVERMTEDMVHYRIRTFAGQLDGRVIAPSDSLSLVRELHTAGINVRWLGVLRDYIRLEYIRQFVLSEMITRTVRHVLASHVRSALPHVTRTSNGEIDLTPIYIVAVKFFNLVFGTSERATQFWKNELKVKLQRKFHRALSPTEQMESHDLRASILHFPLLTRVLQITGFTIQQSKIESLFQDATRFDVEEPFRIEDIQGITPHTRSIEVDDTINKCLYELAMTHVATSETATSNTDKMIQLLKQKSDAAASTAAVKVDALKKKFEAVAAFKSGLSSNKDSETKEPAAGAGAVTVLSSVPSTDDTSSSPSPSSHIPHSPSSNASNVSSSVLAAMKAAALKESEARKSYHTQAETYLGKMHPLVVASCFKFALDESRQNKLSSALQLATDGLSRCEQAHGLYSQPFILGMITIGEIHMRHGNFGEAIEFFERALLFTDKLHGYHPLLGKLCSYLGRLYLSCGRVQEGVNTLNRGYRIYQDFYGASVAEYLAPLITMGKGEEVATSLGQLAHNIRPLMLQLQAAGLLPDQTQIAKKQEQNTTEVVSYYDNPENASANADEIYALYTRLCQAIRIIEDMEGLSRGYFMGKSLDLPEMPRKKIDFDDDSLTPEQLNMGNGVWTEETKHMLASRAQEKIQRTQQELAAISNPSIVLFGSGLTTARAGELQTFLVKSCRVPYVTLTSPHGTTYVATLIPSSSPNIYICHYFPTQTGNYTVTARYFEPSGGGKVAQTTILVQAGRVFVQRCVAAGDGLVKAEVGTPAEFTITCFDSDGNLCTNVNPDFNWCGRATRRATQGQVVKFSYQGNGVFKGVYTPVIDGATDLDVQSECVGSEAYLYGCRGPLPGSVFTFDVTAPAGKRRCGIKLFHIKKTVSLCGTCSNKYTSFGKTIKCFMCKGPINGAFERPAPCLMCVPCHAKLVGRCLECNAFVHHDGNMAPMCRQCSTGIQDTCVGKV